LPTCSIYRRDYSAQTKRSISIRSLRNRRLTVTRHSHDANSQHPFWLCSSLAHPAQSTHPTFLCKTVSRSPSRTPHKKRNPINPTWPQTAQTAQPISLPPQDKCNQSNHDKSDILTMQTIIAEDPMRDLCERNNMPRSCMYKKTGNLPSLLLIIITLQTFNTLLSTHSKQSSTLSSKETNNTSIYSRCLAQTADATPTARASAGPAARAATLARATAALYVPPP
jgi:hypothetical protein